MHLQILAQLDQYKLYPDFNNYLAFIFGKADQMPVEVIWAPGCVEPRISPSSFREESSMDSLSLNHLAIGPKQGQVSMPGTRLSPGGAAKDQANGLRL